jgi:hypothetical protein
MTDYAIVDLDGTISDCSWRVLFATDAKMEPDRAKKQQRWDEFHQRCGQDEPHLGELLLVRAWIKAGNRVAFLTGRPVRFQAITQDWLQAYGLPVTNLFMRGNTDLRPTAEFKLSVMLKIQESLKPGDRIAFVLEDKQNIVDMWRASGFTCLQPRPSAF